MDAPAGNMEMDAGYACIVGIDVHKTMLAVVVRQQSGTQIEYEKRKFGTVRSEIEHLAAWPQHHRVEEVVLESTAQYWRPVWYGLEGHFQAASDAPVEDAGTRGRKRDFPDAQRLADRGFSFAGLFARLQPRLEGKGAAWVLAHRISRLIWLILHEEIEYEEKGPARPNQRTLMRKLRHLVREFGRQGMDVKSLVEKELATAEQPVTAG